VEVRVAGELRPGDVGRIVELHGVLYAREWGFDSTFEAYVAEPLGRFVLTRTPRERLWLVEEGEGLMGCLAIVRVSDEEAQLRWFLLHPSLRGHGLGRRLLEQAIAFCRECGYRRVILWTVSHLQVAGHLYAAAGFRVVEEKTGRLWGQSVTEQRYLLELV
jgi:GNAT superfamily N-acetyltransferase